MGRKCSHCGNIGHNSRTCNIIGKGHCNLGGGTAHGVRVFGVQLDTSSSIPHLKKSFSFDCLSASSSSQSSSSSQIPINEHIDKSSPVGYLSDGPLGQVPEKKKGVPWTEEEHHMFLIGLEKLGKGDWRGISRNFVTTRTPTQVASHAQKYFLRQNSLNKKKRRSSLFDMVGANNAASKPEVFLDLNCCVGEDEEHELVNEQENGEDFAVASHQNFIWSYESLSSTMEAPMSYDSPNSTVPELELTLSSAPMNESSPSLVYT